MAAPDNSTSPPIEALRRQIAELRRQSEELRASLAPFERWKSKVLEQARSFFTNAGDDEPRTSATVAIHGPRRAVRCPDAAQKTARSFPPHQGLLARRFALVHLVPRKVRRAPGQPLGPSGRERRPKHPVRICPFCPADHARKDCQTRKSTMAHGPRGESLIDAAHFECAIEAVADIHFRRRERLVCARLMQDPAGLSLGNQGAHTLAIAV
jgi:hypothetical protein